MTKKRLELLFRTLSLAIGETALDGGGAPHTAEEIIRVACQYGAHASPQPTPGEYAPLLDSTVRNLLGQLTTKEGA